jgi:hypothetical protein
MIKEIRLNEHGHPSVDDIRTFAANVPVRFVTDDGGYYEIRSEGGGLLVRCSSMVLGDQLIVEPRFSNAVVIYAPSAKTDEREI